MNQDEALVALDAMRSNPKYNEAEVLRQSTAGGAVTLAKEDPKSAKHGAVLLMINTWETIAVLLENVDPIDRVFEVTPVCHMYTILKPAMDIVGAGVPSYGEKFATLYQRNLAWLEKAKKDGKYKSAACDGQIHSKFG